MVYAPNSGRSRWPFAPSFKLGLMPDASGGDLGRPPRDLKKLVLVVGLGTLSWVATYVGMLELIQANMGDLPLVHKLIIGFSVAMLMTMIIWLLDQMFQPVGLMTRLAYIAGYIFLSIISVGFGFGFYWKVLESRSESGRSAEIAVTGVQTALNGATTRLEQLNATLVQLAELSRTKAETERTKGTSCPNSKPGDGPRRRMRDEDAQRFAFASEFVAGRVTAVKADMHALDADLAKIATNDPSIIDAKSGTRNEFMKGLGRKLDMTVSSFNALRTDPQLQQLRQDLADRADRTTFGDPKAGGFLCPDPELTQALRGAVRAIGELPALETPAIAAVEGSEATIEAFRRLTTTFFGLLSFKLPPSADELRELQKKAIQQVEAGPAATAAIKETGGGLTTRDYVPLAVAIFVDICLFLVSLGRNGHRLEGLMPKMREAERGPVIEILSRFNDIHRDAGIRESFELFRHVVFDIHGAYYVAVPLDAPPNLSPTQREQLRTEAQLLANLFTSFEKDRIFARTWTPFAGAVRKKLARQGSKFAGSEAFRVYKFRDGAWSEIILGAVMGAARRAEAEAQRQRIERDLLRREPTLEAAFEPKREPATGPPRVHPERTQTERTRAERTQREHARPESASADRDVEALIPEAEVADASPMARARAQASAGRDWTTLSAAPRQDRAPFAKPAVPASDVFGPYARSAEAELSAGILEADDEDALATPANSNTAPPLRAETARAPETALRMPAPAEPRVDVVLRRETATVTLPLDAASEQNGLIGRIGQALSELDLAPEPNAPAITVLEHSEAVTSPQEAVASEDRDLSTDSSFDDATVIAARLRPAVGEG